ncbi:MAG: MFS transporter [Terracidiphilus sp.]
MPKIRAPLRVTTLIAGAFFMEMLDATIIATALPQMARSFHVGPVSLNIGMTAYMLTLAVFIPISGWMADRMGSRTVFAAAIGVFTVASGLCGISTTLGQFILFRILQGVGGAMMVPVGRLIVLRTAPKEKLTQALALITWPGLSALVIGPPLGGFITTYLSWHWIFFLNLPVGLLALVLALVWIENVRGEDLHPFDWTTFVLGGFGSAGAVYGLERLGGDVAHWKAPVAILAASVLSGVVAVQLARHRPERSLIDFESLRLKTFSLCVNGASPFRVAVGVLPFLLPMMFQIAFGLTAFQAGLYLLVLFAGDFSMKALVIPILRRWGFRRVIIVNGICVALSMVFCSAFTPRTPVWTIVLILYVHGACRSMEFTSLTTLAFAEIPPERMSRANGFLSAVMQLSSGMGVAVGAITVSLVAAARGHSVNQPQLNDFRLAILFMSVLALGPVIDSLGMDPRAGADTSGHAHPHLGETQLLDDSQCGD